MAEKNSSSSTGTKKTRSASTKAAKSTRKRNQKNNDDFDDELSNFDFEAGIHDDDSKEVKPASKPRSKSNKNETSESSESSDSSASDSSANNSSDSSEKENQDDQKDGGRRQRYRSRRRSAGDNTRGSDNSGGRGRNSSNSSNSSNRNSGNRNSGGGGGRNRGASNSGGGGGRNRGSSNSNSNSGGRNRGGGAGNRGRSQGNRGRSQGNRSVRSVDPNINIEDITGTIEGVLELHPKGYGFLRDAKKSYTAQATDAFVSSSVIEKHRLREGIKIKGEVGAGTRGQGPRLKEIETIDGRTLEEYAEIKFFDDLTAINPFEQITLERGPRPITMRVMDLLTPIGKGQRALIVAPPRTGKTMLLQDIAESVTQNHPEIKLIVLLIDERPEEVTEMQRSISGEVVASSMDRDVESHVRISQLIIERGKRLAEAGEDVFILLDSITRTARAFNKWVGNTGRTMTGGLDVKALDIPKKMFGTARRFDEGGSLTVCATALIDTGSRMDEVIFQEFKGTGNMELVLSRDLADRRIWPAIDIGKSGTRREEKILDPDALDGTIMLRRSLVSLSSVEAMEQLTRTLERFPTNAEFLMKIKSIL